MASTLNKVLLIGHLGDEIKMHYFEGGNSIGRFPLATNETYTNRKTSEKVTTTEWHTIVVKNKLAEICEKYLTKGDKIYLEGKIKNRQWEGQDGIKRYNTEIHVSDLMFLNTKKETVQHKNVVQPNQKEAPTIIPKKSTEEEENDGLPF